MSSLPICRAYVRVSSEMQADDGESLPVQEARVKEHSNYKRWILTKIYKDEGISAKDITGRPGLVSLLNEIQKGEYVLVTDLSRFSRNTKDALNMFEYIKEKGAFFTCLSPDLDFSSSIGELIFTVMMAVHKIERDNISKHVSQTLRQLVKEKRFRPKPPFGWKYVGKDKDMVSDEEQQQVISKICKMYRSGMKITPISEKLNQDGDNKVLGKYKKDKNKDRVFHPETVKRILMDKGLIQSINRTPIEHRIISHHKSAEAQSQNSVLSQTFAPQSIVRFEGPGPILQIMK